MAGLISIFDIPIITDLLAQYLTKQDCASCSLVSKAFHFQFQPHLWREISIRPVKAALVRQPSKEALLANKHLIRKLSIFDQPITGATQSTGTFALPGQTTTTSALYEPHSRFAHHVTPPPFSCTKSALQMKQDDDDNVRSLLRLVEQNVRLQTWFIDLFGMLDTSNTWMRFFKVLERHPSLTSLYLHGQEFHHGVYKALFQSLPMTLEKLVIRTVIYNKVTPIHFSIPPGRGFYRRLRSVHLRMCMKGSETSTLFPFLRLCPKLEELTVPLVDGSAMPRLIALVGDAALFPSLRGLYMSCQFQLRDTDLSRLVGVMKGRIKDYAMEGRCAQDSARQFCANLTTHWAGTLESLVFGADTVVSSSEIQTIATTCGGLKRLCIASRGGEYEADRMVVPEDNVSGWKAIFTVDNREQNTTLSTIAEMKAVATTKTTQWICLGLEELQLTILDDRWIVEEGDQGNDTENSNHSHSLAPSGSPHTTTSQQRRAKDGIRRVYQQLGQLTRLKTLTLSWYSSLHRREQPSSASATSTPSPSLPARHKFDMSLESGLQYMDRLKELHELNVRGISCLNIGQKEVEWMTQNWPKLRRCMGLAHDCFALENGSSSSSRAQGAGESSSSNKAFTPSTSRTREPQHIQWLHTRHPNVEIW
jgi:hypothetical protein